MKMESSNFNDQKNRATDKDKLETNRGKNLKTRV